MRLPVALLFTLSLLVAPGCTAPAAGLFNGRDLTGWEFVAVPAMAITTVCTVRPDGVITVTGKPVGFLATTASYHDYQLHVEWRWSAKPGNGGVLVHISSGPKDRAWPLCLQLQTKHGSVGDLLPMAGTAFAEPLTQAAIPGPALKVHTAPDNERPAGEWNTCDISCRGDTIEVMINGVRQNSITRVVPAAGRVGFQLEGSPYELRNVRLTPLE
jgi:hypothetical protein